MFYKKKNHYKYNEICGTEINMSYMWREVPFFYFWLNFNAEGLNSSERLHIHVVLKVQFRLKK